jgi:hypothetical protein
MRTTKKERKENAKNFYNTFMNSNCNQAAIVVERTNSSNPNICRCRFLAVRSTLAFMEAPLIIAESVLGISGCFIEFLESIGLDIGTQKSYFDDGFNDWLYKMCKFRITYKDGLVFMFEKDSKEV